MKIQKQLWTHSKARLQQVYTDDSEPYNWLFLPGGPGLGSESLRDLIELLSLPGTMWCVDFPGDGSNISENEDLNFSNWQEALIEATSKFENTILVAHSSGGMFALATSELEKNLIGLVLMDSAPNSDWQKYFSDYVKANPIFSAEKLQKLYDAHPSDATLKDLTIAGAPYFSTKKNAAKIASLLSELPFCSKSHKWAEKNFDHWYQAKWIPQNIPTMIFAGDQDHLTPIKLFFQTNGFQRENIHIHEIENASHFPWLDNPEQVKELFNEYCQWIQLKSNR